MHYSDNEILRRLDNLYPSMTTPTGFWLAFVRSSEQTVNEFSDMAYLMFNNETAMVSTCTTVPGLPALQGGYKRYNKKGAAVICADKWMNKAFKSGLHNGKMRCLRQHKHIHTTRDGNGNSVAEEYGEEILGMWNTNIHCSTYNRWSKLVRRFIGPWSYGCIVYNNTPEYYAMLSLVKEEPISVIVLNEWSI